MRILLDAYFDNNFGDDLFVNTILSRYPDAQFYVFWSKETLAVLDRAAKFSNLVILPQDCVLQSCWPFDGYIMIGGDVLPDGIDYSVRIGWMEQTRKHGGFVAMLGFSLYENYSGKTIADLEKMAELADAIVTRDHTSHELYERMVPGAQVVDSTDMAFTLLEERNPVIFEAVDENKGYELLADDNNRKSSDEGKDILGFSVRRKLYSTDEEFELYCIAMAAIADAYIERHEGAAIRFLAFSTGEYDDRVVATSIVKKMHAENRVNTEVVAYTGDLPEFITSLAECSAIVTTRFHALVFALLKRIPFLPVPYEVKLTQLLDELGYEEERIAYGKAVSEEQLEACMYCLDTFGVSEEKLCAYEEKANLFFEKTDLLVEKARNSATLVQPEKYSSFLDVLHEKEERELAYQQLQRDNAYLKLQIEELTKWKDSLVSERDALIAMYEKIDGVRAMQSEKLEDFRKHAII